MVGRYAHHASGPQQTARLATRGGCSIRFEGLQRILTTAFTRQGVEKYAHLATPTEILENDFNLNIPRYIDTFEEEAEIDLMAVRKERQQLKAELAGLEAQMAMYLKELGYE